MQADRHANKQTDRHADHNTFYPWQGRGNYLWTKGSSITFGYVHDASLLMTMRMAKIR